MPTSINTNIASLNAQRNLMRTGADLTTAVQRLSSGLRINSAKDDAAGIAVASRMTTQIGGLAVAIRNANDGISVSQTAEGAMEEMASNMNRAHDLAVQAASYNNSTDRTSINKEVSQILEEMSRIVSQTRYNGDTVLTGNFSGNFQIGAFVNETINVGVANLSPNTMGVATNYSTISGLSATNLATRIGLAQNTAITGGTSSIDGTTFSTTRAAGTTSDTKIADINALTAQTGTSAFSYGNGAVGLTYATATAPGAISAGFAAGALTINGVQIGSVGTAAGNTNGQVGDAIVTAINLLTAQTGVTATNVAAVDGTATNAGIVLTNTNGNAITVTTNTSVVAGISTYFNASTSVGAGANGAIILNDDLADTTATYNTSTTGAALTGVSSSTTSLTAATLNSQTVTTAASANLAMLVFEKALDTINSERSTIGAKLNRLESVTRNLANVRENITAARGRIQDADFAEETAKLTRAQILSQAGTAMVAQANQIPQGVLSLLGR